MVNNFEEVLLQNFVQRRVTFLGAGPMSTISVDSVIELANEFKEPIALIPSRRQIESASLGGGYVNSWTTEDFVKYVRNRDKGSFVKLSRDHSGPWQFKELNDEGQPFSHNSAIEEAKESLKTDLSVGFDLIHIDPSKGLKFGRSQAEVEEDIYELLEFCKIKMRLECQFEIGADDQSSIPDLVSNAEIGLRRILSTIKDLGLPKPLFFVLQTGTKVMELRNIGSFDSKLPVQGYLPASVQLPEMIKMCMRNNILLKAHNTDYLSDKAIAWHRRFGIHAANVAPEFGVAETRALLKIAAEHNQNKFIETFGNMVLAGNKWEKWMLPNSSASDFDRLQIAGHYHFNESNFIEIRDSLKIEISKKGINMDNFIKAEVKNSVLRYLKGFGYGTKR